MQVLTIAVQKGGTGKTTTAAALSYAAVKDHKKVLAIDLDTQGNLSYSLNMRTGSNVAGSYDLLAGMNPDEIIQHLRNGLDAIPANWQLSTMKAETGSARHLQTAIEPLKRLYDVIIIDTPPTAGTLQYNALQAATGLIIPLKSDVFSVQSLYQIVDTARQFQDSNPLLSIKGIVLTQYSKRSIIDRQMGKKISDAAAEYGLQIIGRIRQGVAVKEATALQENLYQYAPKSKPAADYWQLYRKLFKD